jgi:hypothetical protein
VVGNVRIRFKVNAIENACLVARAIQLMTHGEFAEGYNLIKDMEGGAFLTALRMLAGRECCPRTRHGWGNKAKPPGRGPRRRLCCLGVLARV